MTVLKLYFAFFIYGCNGLLFDSLLSLLQETTSTTTTAMTFPQLPSQVDLPSTKDCPQHLSRNRTLIYNPFSQRCYQFQTAHKNWRAAQAECAALGGILAEVKSSRDDVYLNMMAIVALGISYTDKYMWIGAQDAGYTGQYQWKSGSPVNYAHWDTGSPLSGMCVAIDRSTAYWETKKCQTEYQSLCQFEKDAVPKSTSVQTSKITTHLPVHTTQKQQTAVAEMSGECPFCTNETDIRKCHSTKNCPSRSEACYLKFTKDGATAGCSSDIIKCYQQKRHNTPECSYRPIPFEAHPNTTCAYCCDITMHSCFTDMLKFSVYAQGQK